jgi:hypothetical protein
MIPATKEPGFYCVYIERLTNVPDGWVVARWHHNQWWAPGIGYPVQVEKVREIAFAIILPKATYH